ncbi:MAG: hypothetical protein U0792_23055 [Gemmataceae bacterium]
MTEIREGLALDPAWPAGAFDPKEPYGVNAAAFAGHLAELRKVVAANPGQPTLAFLLGYQLWFIREKPEAKKWFAAAEKLLPGPDRSLCSSESAKQPANAGCFNALSPR